MSTLTLRPASALDLTLLATLEARSTAHPWSEGQYRGSFESGHQLFIAQLDAEIVGLAVIMLVLDEAHLLNIVIDHDWQGQGLGRQLLGELMLRMRQQGALRMFLEVRESNAIARSLYESLGFSECGIRKHYYRAEQGREHAILMEASL
ncbi:ribosomal protein S18-alanine N-acetyltransferase [Crenobacter sp. SG2305]|uniref:ribosomal protein S18-alanine N-acetyltransferase n=1 Tax=Crenobacter oryzisoli TaxID=3056844 RepID=UPI0025AA6744|nr:ribosomal protein S18-alanine N-acetyltransferase [Crenobacter sp. SG2305]MDN0081441.1 ribosomal protein S18-alanine N-acetyltransferase [Crenobacter sp. SG2305]